MALSVDRVAREAASNLWRNRLMTVAAVLTVAVSLSLVGAAFLLRQGVNTATTRWRGGVNLAMFFQPSATKSEINAVHTLLKNDPDIKSFYFMDKQASYQEMGRLLPNSGLTNNVSPSDMPPSYRVTLRDASLAGSVSDQFRSQPGMKEIQTPGQEIKTLLRVTNVLQYVVAVVAIILLTSASALILNTIRMAIFSRRREVAVMKLVGATNWFIRVPFMLEGLVQGLLGAGMAAGVVLVLDWLLGVAVRHQVILQSVAVTGHEVLVIELLVLTVGGLVGFLGSGIAVRRFLEV
jgi:cell division transport system permease protein